MNTGDDMELLLILGAVIFVLFSPLAWWIIWWVKAGRRGISDIPSLRTLPLFILHPLLCLLVMVAYSNSLFPPSGMIEAKKNLVAISGAQAAYFAAHQTYARSFAELNWKPAAGTMYCYYLVDDYIANTKGIYFPYSPDGDWPFAIRPAASATGFRVIAISNIDNDISIDAWSINEKNALVHLFDDRYEEDTSGFFINPPPFTLEQRWAKLKSQINEALSPHYYQLLIVNFVLAVIFIVRDVRRWRKAKALAE